MNTTDVDLAKLITALVTQLAEHEDMSDLRHAVLLERLAALEGMIASAPTAFAGSVELPIVGRAPLTLGPVRR